MMPDHEFCDSCPGCRPALLDINTHEVLSNDSPVMKIVNQIWDNETTYAQRKAFIEVTLHNSRLPNEMKLWQEVNEKITKALEKNDG